MTAPALALDAPCGSPACHGHRCPRVRHGYVRGEMRGKCSQHRHCRAFELDELAELEVPDAAASPATDETTDGRAVEAEAADRPADPTTPHVTDAVIPPATTLISAWNAWHCPTCSSRWFTPASCCGRAPIPVRIEMHVREADGG